MPVKKDGLERYKVRAAKFAPIWKDHGAICVTEALADNLMMGEATSFPRAAQLADDEVCVVTIIRFPDKATHDRAIEAAMSDPRAMDLDFSMVDGARIVFASFVPFVDEKVALQLDALPRPNSNQPSASVNQLINSAASVQSA